MSFGRDCWVVLLAACEVVGLCNELQARLLDYSMSWWRVFWIAKFTASEAVKLNELQARLLGYSMARLLNYSMSWWRGFWIAKLAASELLYNPMSCRQVVGLLNELLARLKDNSMSFGRDCWVVQLVACEAVGLCNKLQAKLLDVL